MSEELKIENRSPWKTFLKRHWGVFAVFIIAVIAASVGSVYVFLWFVAQAQSTGLVPSVLALGSMGNLVTFILHLIFWELVYIGIPAVIGVVMGWLWWSRLPYDERREYNIFGGGSRSGGAGGAVEPLLFIAFAIKVYVDGNWNVPISIWKLDYVVGTMITILVWIVGIAAIPLTIGSIWWLNREMRKEP